MNRDQFWAVLENLARSEEDIPEGAELVRCQLIGVRPAESDLKYRLSKLSDADLISFGRLFEQIDAELYRWDLFRAAWLIEEGGCSDDGFMDFRSGLLSYGRRAVETALADPDDLADVLEYGCIADEMFGRVPVDVIEGRSERVYEEWHAIETPYPSEPSGEFFEFSIESLPERFPKLWKRFSEFCGL